MIWLLWPAFGLAILVVIVLIVTSDIGPLPTEWIWSEDWPMIPVAALMGPLMLLALPGL